MEGNFATNFGSRGAGAGLSPPPLFLFLESVKRGTTAIVTTSEAPPLRCEKNDGKMAPVDATLYDLDP